MRERYLANVEIIERACFKANPNILGRRPEAHVTNNKLDEPLADSGRHHPVRLADVLLAIWEVTDPFGDRGTVILNLIELWYLMKDDLHDQSYDTLQFLADLLR